jgi:hypothetical protein
VGQEPSPGARKRGFAPECFQGSLQREPLLPAKDGNNPAGRDAAAQQGPLQGEDAPFDLQFCTCHKPRLVGSQVQNGERDIRRFANTSQGNLSGKLVLRGISPVLAPELIQYRRIDERRILMGSDGRTN